MSGAFVDVRNVSMSFAGNEGAFMAIRDVNLTVAPSEFVCVLGPSGSGKSTLLRILAGILEATRGSVSITSGESDVAANDMSGKTRRSALVFQNSNLLPWFSVIDNVMLPLKVHGVPDAEARAKAADWLAKVGLRDVENECPATLSGGMAQRVAIARALIQEPDLLLLDEPFGALDAMTRETLSEELLRTWETVRPSVVMVTHSISEAVLLADRVVIFSGAPGTVVSEIEIDLPRPRLSELRYEKQFIEITRRIRAEISGAIG